MENRGIDDKKNVQDKKIRVIELNDDNADIDKDNIEKPNRFSKLKGLKSKIGRKSISEIDAKKEKDEKDTSMNKEWYTYTKQEKIRYIVFSILKVILFIILLYLFLLSLNFMTIGFTMVTSYALQIGDIIKFVLANPFAGLAIGIIATAIMQNATATTSIAVSMVGAGIIPSVKSAIPIIMGSNIGTCVTNSFIALTLSGDPNEFKRAFSAATLNDVFNLMTTTVLITIEIIFDMLYHISNAITNAMPFENADQMASANFMAAILNPVTDLFIRLNVTAIDIVNGGNKDLTEVALRCCATPTHLEFVNNTNLTNYLLTLPLKFNETIKLINVNLTNFSSNNYYNYIFDNKTLYANITECHQCGYWCMPMLKAFGDGGTGLFWIILSLIVLIACLFGIVKVLSLLIVGPIAKGVNKAVNASFPGKFKWLTQVVLFLISLLLTLVVQSSNIVTATLVPLCGIGIVTLQRVYVMTLGSNIGTTVTGILSAFTQPPSSLKKAMQLAFVYTLFNTFGVIFWLPIPFLRFPKIYARKLGNIVFQYRWFLYVYVSMIYFILPLILLGLALIPMWIGLALFGIPLIVLFLSYIVLKVLRKWFPKILPEKLKKFDWLPVWLRSLDYYDAKMNKISCKCCCNKKKRITAKVSDLTDIKETNVDEDYPDEGPSTIPNVIRRLSAIDSIVKEARIYSRRNTIASHESSSEDEHDTEAAKDFRKRKSIYKIDENQEENANRF